MLNFKTIIISCFLALTTDLSVHQKAFAGSPDFNFSSIELLAENAYRPNPKYEKNRNHETGNHFRGEGNPVKDYFPKWRDKSDQIKLSHQIAEYKSYLKQNKTLTEGLIPHESKTNHTIARHVGVSVKGLLSRIEHEKVERAKEKNEKVDHNDLTMEAFSTFKSLREADRLVDRVLSDKSNQHILKNWVSENNKLKKNKTKDKDNEKNIYEKNLQPLELKNMGQITGLAIDPISKAIIEPRGVKVLLRIDRNNPRGWSIATAFPIP